MKQDIRLIEYSEDVTDNTFLKDESGPIICKWKATAKLQVFKDGKPFGNHFIFKYGLLASIYPKKYWKDFKQVTDKDIVFVIEVPEQEKQGESFGIHKSKIHFPYPIGNDWDFYNYYRQDVQTLNSQFYLKVNEREWYGLFMHYMPEECMRAFRKLSKPVILS